MKSKVILTVSSIVLFAQLALAQTNCCSSNAGLGIGLTGNGLAGYRNGLEGRSNTYVGSGGSLGVTTYSPIAPAGISVLSENGIEGTLCIDGALPVLSAVTLEGQLPTSGQAGVQYGCGNGNVGITSGYGAGQAGAGWNNGAGLAGSGLGYGSYGPVGVGQAGGQNGCGCGV